MCDEKGKPFITTLYNVLLALDFYDRLFYIITLMNKGNTCPFHGGFCTVFFSANQQNTVILPNSAQRNHAFLVKIKEKSKSKTTITKKKFSLELLHQR